LAKLNYFIDVLTDSFKTDEVGLAVVNVNCDFLAQSFINEPLEVISAVTAVSERSLRLEQRIVNQTTGEVKSVCRSVMAGFDVKSASSAAIDNEWRKRLSQYEHKQF
jgi:acyl-CoA thioester hydrolase